MSVRSVEAAATITLSCTKRLKPGAVTSIRYSPGLRLGALYSPEELATVLTVAFVPRCRIFNDAPGTAAPCGSETIPLMLPRSVCAKAIRQKDSRAATRERVNANL